MSSAEGVSYHSPGTYHAKPFREGHDMASANSTKVQGLLFDPTPTEKACSKCKKIKPLSDFYKNPRMKLGVTSACKECTREETRITAANQQDKADKVTGKSCRDCKVFKPLDDFHRSRTCKFGRESVCSACQNAKTAERHAKLKNDPEYRQKMKVKDRTQGLQRYGLTDSSYQVMYDSQKGLCAICNKPECARQNKSISLRSLCVDHDHKTGKVRQLLCSQCNHGLGNFKEDIAVLLAAADYLKRHSENP